MNAHRNFNAIFLLVSNEYEPTGNTEMVVKRFNNVRRPSKWMNRWANSLFLFFSPFRVLFCCLFHRKLHYFQLLFNCSTWSNSTVFRVSCIRQFTRKYVTMRNSNRYRRHSKSIHQLSWSISSTVYKSIDSIQYGIYGCWSISSHSGGTQRHWLP